MADTIATPTQVQKPNTGYWLICAAVAAAVYFTLFEKPKLAKGGR